MRPSLTICLTLSLLASQAMANPPHAEPPPAEVQAGGTHVAAAAPAGGEAITAVPAPASGLGMATETMTRPEEAEPFYTAHRLKGVRVQTLDGSLRLIFAFDQIAPYNLRITPGAREAQLELISTEVGFLAPELVQLNRNELSGIWLTRANEALSVLELRLPTDKVRIEHFTLPEMGVLVLDLYRTDTAGKRVGDQPLVSSTEAREGGLPLSVMLARGTQPTAVATATDAVAEEPDSEAERMMAPVSPAMLGVDLADAGEPAGVELEPVHATPATTETESGGTLLSAADLAALPELHEASASQQAEIRPLDVDYDYFPLSAIRAESPLGQEIVESFQFKDWEGVVDKSVRQYFKRNPMGREGVAVLYMVAEARWQLAQQGGQALYNLATIYEQAVSMNGGGPLGAFGHWRLAQIAAQMHDPHTALDYLVQADQTSEPELKLRIARLRARMLQQTQQFATAAAELDKLIAGERRPRELAALWLEKGSVLADKGEKEAAWDAYTRATEADPAWINLHVEAAMKLARLGLETGRLDAARTAADYLRVNFSFQSRPEMGTELMLLTARIMAAQGEKATAEQYFRKYLEVAETPVDGLDAELMRLNPAEVAASKQRFCELLWSENRFREAMAEFDRSYTQSLRGGVDTAALTPLAAKIVPSFMEYAVAAGQPGDAVEAWQRFGSLVHEPAARVESMAQLADAMGALGLYEQALATLDQLPDPMAGYPQTKLKRARVLAQMGEAGQALEGVAVLLPALEDAAYRVQALELQANSYERLQRPLEAAQSWRALAAEDGTPGQARGEALVRAGELFLQAGAADQAASAGLKGLVREQEAAARGADPGWNFETGTQLRLVLGRAYLAQGDDARAGLVFADYRARPGAPIETRSEVGVLLGDIARRQGDTDGAATVYRAVAEDEAAPALWRGIARQNAATLAWNKERPKWAVDF